MNKIKNKFLIVSMVFLLSACSDVENVFTDIMVRYIRVLALENDDIEPIKKDISEVKKPSLDFESKLIKSNQVSTLIKKGDRVVISNQYKNSQKRFEPVILEIRKNIITFVVNEDIPFTGISKEVGSVFTSEKRYIDGIKRLYVVWFTDKGNKVVEATYDKYRKNISAYSYDNNGSVTIIK